MGSPLHCWYRTQNQCSGGTCQTNSRSCHLTGVELEISGVQATSGHSSTVMSGRYTSATILDSRQGVTPHVRPLWLTVEGAVELLEFEVASSHPFNLPHIQCSHAGHWCVTQSRFSASGSSLHWASDARPRGFPVREHTLHWFPSLACLTSRCPARASWDRLLCKLFAPNA